MTWLDDEEANVALCHTGEKHWPIRMRDPGRALRVIRELVEYIKLEDTLPMSYETEEVIQQFYEARLNLSPDAKELLK